MLNITCSFGVTVRVEWALKKETNTKPGEQNMNPQKQGFTLIEMMNADPACPNGGTAPEHVLTS